MIDHYNIAVTGNQQVEYLILYVYFSFEFLYGFIQVGIEFPHIFEPLFEFSYTPLEFLVL